MSKIDHIGIGVLSLTAALANAGCYQGDMEDDRAAMQEEAVRLTNTKDPLGIDLEAVGLSRGDRPCGDDAQVASVVDEAGRYLAFCVSLSGYTSVLQVAPGNVAPVGSPSECALDTYLAATPEDAAVPRALVDACERSPLVKRRIAEGPVVIGAPLVSQDLPTSSSCSDAATFQNNHCAAINTYASGPNVEDAVSWCVLGPLNGTAQRTSSKQGPPGAVEGRTTVAACGTGTTNLKGLVKKPLSNTWAVPSGANVNISPYYVATRDINKGDVSEVDDFGATHYGVDLRFTVTPSAGAWYRYTGAYVEHYPVP